ncbi:MAG: glycosyltransferase, partial [Patescibacteria group bacterium]
SVESSLNYKTIDLTSDSLNVLQAADVVVSRAGLSTLSELAALAKPAIIIPMPDTHQEANAALVSKVGAGLVFKQNSLTIGQLIGTLSQLLNDPVEAAQLASNLNCLIATNGAVKIADEVEKLLEIRN